MHYPMHEKLTSQQLPHQWRSEFFKYLAREGAIPQELEEMHLMGFFRIDIAAFKAEQVQLVKQLSATSQAPAQNPTN